MVHAEAVRRELLGLLAPGGVVLVVEDVVCSESFQVLDFGSGGCRRDDPCAGGLGELDSSPLDISGVGDLGGAYL